MAAKTLSIATAAPWSNRGKSRDSRSECDDLEGEWRRKPLLHHTPESTLSQASYGVTQAYGCAEGSSSQNILNRVPEESGPDEDDSCSEENDEYELEERGLHRGSYTQLVSYYALVPLSSLVAFALLAFLPVFVYSPQATVQYPYPVFLPFPILEILVSMSLWSLSHLLRVPLYSLSLLLAPSYSSTIILSTIFHVVLHNLLRLAALPLLLLHHQQPTSHGPAFRRVWWIALGWSFAEVAVGVSQGYEQITLYRDVLVPLGMDDEFLQDWLDGNRRKIYASEEQTQLVQNGSRGGNVAPERELDQQACAENSIGLQVDRDLDHLMALKGREEVEAVYGIPVIRIPVFVSCLQRLDSIILSLGLTLLLSAAYLPTPISIPAWHRPQSSVIPITSSNRLFYATYSVIVTLHLFLSFLHTPLVLPKIGVHTAAYAGLLVGLGCFFAGLGMWDALS